MNKVLMVGYGTVGKMLKMERDTPINPLDVYEVLKQATLPYNSKYVGAYMMEDRSIVLETVQVFNKDEGIDNLFKTIAYTEESIYETNVINKVKIGNVHFNPDRECIYDLLSSIKQPYTGFTLEITWNGEDDYIIYLLVCRGGEYHKNPYFKNKCLH